MVEDTVLDHLRALHGAQTLAIHSCTVSPPIQHPWGRSYRLVEWTSDTTLNPSGASCLPRARLVKLPRP
jgi:hypothetical protein